MSWVVAAFASAFFAGITSILAMWHQTYRLRHRDCHPHLHGAHICLGNGRCFRIRRNHWQHRAQVLAVPRSLGTCHRRSWICYFKALSIGNVNKVVPVDKMSTVLAALTAIVLFGETSNLAVKLIGTAAITLGTFLMIEKRQSAGVGQKQDLTWLVYAIGAAVFAALTSILAKVGIEGVESNLATAIRTCVVLAMAWAIVAAKGKLEQVACVDRHELAFLAASGIATGASWLFYYYAIAAGQVSVVVQIDKLSILVSVLFARLTFNEKLSRRSGIGLALIVLGTAALAIWK